MRRLVWLAIGFCGGCAVGAYAFQNDMLLPAALFFALGTALLFCLKKQKTALIFLGLAVGIFYTEAYSRYYFGAAKALDQTRVQLTVTVTDYSEKLDFGIRCEGETEIEGKTYRVRFYGNEEMSLVPGNTVTGEFLIKATTPGSSKESQYYQGTGLYLLAYSKSDLSLAAGEEGHIRFFPQRLRKAILNTLRDTFPEDTQGFAKALLLGNTDSLSYDQDVALQTSGIRHIVAVSGLHVSILFALIFTLSGKKPWITALFGIPMLILFAFVAGLTPSIIRACVMQGLMILALLLNREYDPPSALAFAVMVILGLNPFSMVSVSFQLSCGCIVGIFLFSTRLKKYIDGKIKGKSRWHKVLRRIGSSLSVTVGTMIVTTPFCAVYFGSISLVGILTNLLTLWAVSVIFYGIMAVCMLSVLCLPLAKIVAWVLSFLMRYVLWTAELLGNVPLAAVYTASPYIVLWLVVCYALFALFWLTGRRRPVTIAAVMLALLIFATAFSCLEPRLDNYRVTVLDVGQGQCILLQSKGETYMVDCGGSGDEKTADIAAAQLLSQGITRIDGVILTHYDKDHMGGISCFLQRIRADVVYLPKGKTAPAELPAGQKTAQVCDTLVRKIGETKITIIPGVNSEDDNENSTCVLFQAQGCDILITGDRAEQGEKQLLQQVNLPELDYLLAGHHGARNSTNFELLARTRPENVIISVGENSYNHPHDETLERIKSFGCNILRTDINGTIIIRG